MYILFVAVLRFTCPNVAVHNGSAAILWVRIIQRHSTSNKSAAFSLLHTVLIERFTILMQHANFTKLYRFLVENLYLFLTCLCFIPSYVIKSLFHSCPWASLDDLPPCSSIYLNTCARNCDLENNSSRASPCDPMCC